MKTNAKIYVVRAEDGTLKLGHSRNPERRAKELGRVVEIVHTTDVLNEAERIERLAHRVLALHGEHLRGEWFNAEINDAIRAIVIAVKQAAGEQLSLGGRLKSNRMGWPPNRKSGDLIHILIPADLRSQIDAVRESMLDRPSLAAFVRRSLVDAVKRSEREKAGC